ncbi:2-acylglycerol O-acyltransferase 1 [Chelonia mydas]|uniref:Acyltransferase n=1 Tax=Chelonia mydas TaxID=8469 RepID=M7BNJ3_CHEMY|nr:2-acylglycerol O-acyltransferase 1 [Chelonia mydas]
MESAQLTAAVVSIVNTLHIILQYVQNLQKQVRRRRQRDHNSDEDMDTDFSQSTGPGNLDIMVLIKTSDLDPSHNYLFGFHPHGILATGAFGNFCTEYTGFKELFPGFTPYLHILPVWFGCPFFRDYILGTGLVSASEKSLSHVLNNDRGGHIAVIVIGGAEESLDAYPGSLTLNILKRRGFIKMALKNGAHLVPVFSFGENELFKQVANPEGSWLRNLQERLRKTVGFTLPLFHARGIFQYSFGLMPYRKSIHTVVGKPITVKQNLKPTLEEIEQLHQTYLRELSKLFEEHKDKYGIPDHESLIFK